LTLKINDKHKPACLLQLYPPTTRIKAKGTAKNSSSFLIGRISVIIMLSYLSRSTLYFIFP